MPMRPRQGISEDTKLSIEDALSEALTDYSAPTYKDAPESKIGRFLESKMETLKNTAEDSANRSFEARTSKPRNGAVMRGRGGKYRGLK
jgi:hypothetical protein